MHWPWPLRRRARTFCHADAHILLDEAGAVEFFGDLRLTGIVGPDDSRALIADAVARRSDEKLVDRAQGWRSVSRRAPIR